MLEDSRTYLSPFMVSRFYEQSGISEVLKPSRFPDVMVSINPGGVIRHRGGCHYQQGFVYVTVA